MTATERKIVNNTGLQWSKVKMADRFIHAWEQEGCGGTLIKEFVFDSERRWRFDLCFGPPVKLAIEFDGGGFGHMSHKGRKSDMEKRNEAVRQGWRILVYESSMLSLKRLADIVADVIDVLSPPPVDVADLLPIGAC